MPPTWESFWLPNSSNNIPWLIVAAYVLSSGLAAFVAYRTPGRSGRQFWSFVSAALLFLAFNKQFDLQGHLTQFLRQRAENDGWYAKRWSWQFLFVVADGLVALAVAACLKWLATGAGAGVRLTLLGLVLVGAYVVLRAASFHPVDSALRQTFYGIRLHNFAELCCISVIIAGELRAVASR
jgi:hypothetical protein